MTDQKPVETHSDQEPHRDQDDQSDEMGESLGGHHHPGHVGEEDQHVPMGHIDHRHHTPDQTEAEGGYAIDAADEEAVDENLRFHAFMSSPRPPPSVYSLAG